MEAVMFEVKRAHLGVQRFGREMLRADGITPGRFDLLLAIEDGGTWQSRLWRVLRVVRSAVCEMVKDVERIGWVRRVRAFDRRTWVVYLTERGKEVVSRAHGRCILSGRATLHLDAALSADRVERVAERETFLTCCQALGWRFGPPPRFDGSDLYLWRAEDLWTWFMSEDGEPPI